MGAAEAAAEAAAAAGTGQGRGWLRSEAEDGRRR